MRTRILKGIFRKVIIGFLLLIKIAVVHAISITGAGASFPHPIYIKWASDYKAYTKNFVNYQSIGSGGGKQQILSGIIDFGAIDDPMDEETLKCNGLFQFPAVLGGTVVVVNIDGIKGGELKLSGKVLADIFMGSIKKWNDESIRSLNPRLDMPDTDIIVVHRADSSGTTFIWTNYLSKVSSSWKKKIGEGKSVKWPTGQGGKGNEGVSAYISQLKNTIGYVEYTYAQRNDLTWVQIQNKDGLFVQPNQFAFAAAAANANWENIRGMGIMLTDKPGAETWPITAASFILVHQKQEKPDQGKAVLDFFDWAFRYGAKSAQDLDYVPLPDFVIDQVRNSWSEIKSSDGIQPIWKPNIKFF